VWANAFQCANKGSFKASPTLHKQEETTAHVWRSALPHLLERIVKKGCSEQHSNMKSSEKKIVICLAGLTACGKSTAARRLAEKYGLKYVSGGIALKELALKMGYHPRDKGWWETNEGTRFLKERLRDQRFDKKIDLQLLELADQGNVVLDSWTMPWLSKTSFKIWLEVSPRERAKRLSRRNDIPVEEAERIIEVKEEKTKRIYEELYGFELGEDYSPFDLILNSESLTSTDVFEVLSLVIDRLVFGTKTMKL
jgi:cytidylate kinase